MSATNYLMTHGGLRLNMELQKLPVVSKILPGHPPKNTHISSESHDNFFDTKRIERRIHEIAYILDHPQAVARQSGASSAHLLSSKAGVVPSSRSSQPTRVTVTGRGLRSFTVDYIE